MTRLNLRRAVGSRHATCLFGRSSTHRSIRPGAFGLGSLALISLLAARASAHSPPVGISLVWATNDPAQAPLVVTNRGLVFTDLVDGQRRFSLRCVEGYMATSSDSPSILLSANGSLTIGLYNGVFQSDDRACSMRESSGLPEDPIAGVIRTSGDPSSLFVAKPDLEESVLFVSDDDGQSWSERYRSPPDEFYQFLFSAPSAPQRLYATGRRYNRAAMTASFLCNASSDSGKTWEDHVHATKIIPLGVYPQDPNMLLAYEPTDRAESQFRLLRSTDGCATATSVLEGIAQPTAVAMTPDGATVWVGASFRGMGGLYRSDDGGLHFERVLADKVQLVSCLNYRQGRLWMCGNMAPNLDGIWYSDDQGAAFEKFLTFDQLSGQVPCAGDAQAVCDVPWNDLVTDVRKLLGDDAGTADAGSGDAGLDGGTAPPSDADSSTGGDAMLAPGMDAGQSSPEQNDSSGCQASAGARSDTSNALAWFSGAALLIARFRRRRRYEQTA